MLHTKFQAPKPSGSETEKNSMILSKIGKRQLGNATYQILSI